MFYSAYVLVHSHSWFRTLTAISFLFFRALHQSFSFCQHFPILPAPIILPLRPVFVIKSARKFLLVLPRKLPLILQASLQLNYASSNFLEPNRLPAFQQELGRDLSTKIKGIRLSICDNSWEDLQHFKPRGTRNCNQAQLFKQPHTPGKSNIAQQPIQNL